MNNLGVRVTLTKVFLSYEVVNSSTTAYSKQSSYDLCGENKIDESVPNAQISDYWSIIQHNSL